MCERNSAVAVENVAETIKNTEKKAIFNCVTNH